jgi:hypothetical protein
MGLDAAIYKDEGNEEEIASVRLGNVSMIAYLRGAISHAVPEASVLIHKVLYSGSHCGDSLTREEVRLAKSELEKVASRLPEDSEVQDFVSTFGSIIDIALSRDRPIMF